MDMDFRFNNNRNNFTVELNQDWRNDNVSKLRLKIHCIFINSSSLPNIVSILFFCVCPLDAITVDVSGGEFYTKCE